MKRKLIKTEVNYLLKNEEGVIIASTSTKEINKLSKQNCDEIFGVFDLDELAKEEAIKISESEIRDEKLERIYKRGFNKAMALNKDKVFTESDIFSVVNHILAKLVKVDGFDQKYLFPEEVYQEVTWKTKQIQQPTEIEVEIKMEEAQEIYRDGTIKNIRIPKLDSQGCLILKKI